jgi:thymidylate kinase
MVGNQHRAAGTYDITTGLSTLLVRREANGSASFAIALWAYAGKTQEQAKLVFKRYGDRYFLSQVWYPGTNQGRQLQISKVERELAMNSAKPEIVTLLAAVPRAQRAAK